MNTVSEATVAGAVQFRPRLSERLAAWFERSILFTALAHVLSWYIRLQRLGWRFHLALECLKHAFCCVVLPLCMLWFSQAITLQGFGAAWTWLWAHGSACAFFVLLFGAAQLLLRALLGSYGPGTLLCGALAALAALVDHYKAVINGFPLMLSDFTLFPNAGDIVSYAMPKINFSNVTLWSLLLFVVLAIAAWLCRTKLPRRGASLSSFLCIAVSLPLLLSCFGGSAMLDHAAALTDGCAAQEERLDRSGALLGLFSAWAAGEKVDYSSYDADTVNHLQNMLYLAQQEDGAGDTENAVKPHILMILSESFFDVTRFEGITFREDPLPNFHRLCETSTNGRFLSSTYAGGTGNVELETLTGFSGDLLKESDAITALQRRDGDVYAALPSAAHDAAANGYETYYIHSHNSTLYRRAEVMPALGFEHVIFSDDFEVPVNFSGLYVSDRTLVNEVIDRFENRESDAPVFMQITTMENHQPYTAEKYSYSSGLDYTCESLNDSEREVLDALLTGLNHADAALGELVDYFEACGEPVMIVFYGDHLPSMTLSDASTLYSTLGSVPTVDSLQWTPDELKEMLSTDYLIWTNYETEPEADCAESSVLLGANVFARAGLDRSPYFHWLSETASRDYLLSRPRLFVAADGTAEAEVPADGAQTLDAQRMMQYDLVYGEQKLLKYFRVEENG